MYCEFSSRELLEYVPHTFETALFLLFEQVGSLFSLVSFFLHLFCAIFS